MRPGYEIAAQIQTELETAFPDGLMIPTLTRCTTGHQAALAGDSSRIDTELAERGWLVIPGDDDPLLSAIEVADLLGVKVQTARRRLADGSIPAMVCKPRARGVERYARLSDVQKLRRERADSVCLQELADDVKQPYHSVYQLVRASGLTLIPSGARSYWVPEDTVRLVREHYSRQAMLNARAIPISVAAGQLSASPPTVRRYLDDGLLVEDDRRHDGSRMVTRESVKALLAERSNTPRTVPTVTWAQAREMAGVTSPELQALGA